MGRAVEVCGELIQRLVMKRLLRAGRDGWWGGLETAGGRWVMGALGRAHVEIGDEETAEAW